MTLGIPKSSSLKFFNRFPLSCLITSKWHIIFCQVAGTPTSITTQQGNVRGLMVLSLGMNSNSCRADSTVSRETHEKKRSLHAKMMGVSRCSRKIHTFIHLHLFSRCSSTYRHTCLFTYNYNPITLISNTLQKPGFTVGGKKNQIWSRGEKNWLVEVLGLEKPVTDWSPI